MEAPTDNSLEGRGPSGAGASQKEVKAFLNPASATALFFKGGAGGGLSPLTIYRAKNRQKCRLGRKIFTIQSWRGLHSPRLRHRCSVCRRAPAHSFSSPLLLPIC